LRRTPPSCLTRASLACCRSARRSCAHATISESP
jgi:hypothetical protein